MLHNIVAPNWACLYYNNFVGIDTMYNIKLYAMEKDS
jgi:hypothetical protein